MFVLSLKGWAGISQEEGTQEDGTMQGQLKQKRQPGRGLEVRKKIMCPGSSRQFRIIGA